MDKSFSIIAVDDKPETLEPVLYAVQQMLGLDGISIHYSILSKQDEVDHLI